MGHTQKSTRKDSAELLSQEEADKLVAQIVYRTRNHPLLTRGAGVRATLAIGGIAKGFKQATGRLDRHAIERSALIALPHRIVVAAHTGKSAYEIVREITREILYQTISYEYVRTGKRKKTDMPGEKDQDRLFLDELIDFQDQEYGITRLTNLKTHFTRQHNSGKAVSPENLDCQTLAVKLHALEEQGILCFDEVGEGYALQGQALLYLAEHMLHKDLSKLSISQKKESAREKSYVRKYQKGDTYRNVSQRHTLRQLIRRCKPVTEITVHDLKSFEKMPFSDKDIAVCIDVSESMARDGKLRFAKIAAAAIAQAAGKQGDRTGLVVFSNAAAVIHSLTKDQHRIADALVRIKAGKLTNIGDGIKKCREILLRDNFSNTKYIIVISDGIPNLSSADEYYQNSYSSDCNEMDTFNLSIGAQTHGHGNSLFGQDVKIMFMNIRASDYAVKEAKISWKKNIKISFLYMGGQDTHGIHLARKLARVGGGTFYAVPRMQDVPHQALKMI